MQLHIRKINIKFVKIQLLSVNLRENLSIGSYKLLRIALSVIKNSESSLKVQKYSECNILGN